MLEALIALLGFAALAGLALLVMYVPPLMLAWVSTGLTLVGFSFGVPMGIYYHVLLRRELLRVGPLPARWWMHPHLHHGALDEDGLKRVMPWFLLGGLGFVLIVAGFGLAMVTLVTSR